MGLTCFGAAGRAAGCSTISTGAASPGMGESRKVRSIGIGLDSVGKGSPTGLSAGLSEDSCLIGLIDVDSSLIALRGRVSMWDAGVAVGVDRSMGLVSVPDPTIEEATTLCGISIVCF